MHRDALLRVEEQWQELLLQRSLDLVTRVTYKVTISVFAYNSPSKVAVPSRMILQVNPKQRPSYPIDPL